jgi:damage-control phosphatase, subfamily I
MKTSLDCIPCFVRQAADAVKISASSDNERQRLMRNVLQWLSEIDMYQSPPAISQIINRRVREILAMDDPYRAAKDSHNALAAALISSIRRRITTSFDPLTMAVRYAITGNIIDLGAKNGIGSGDIYAELQSAYMQPIFGDMEAFKKAISEAQTILYLADNAGEIFFDRLLIEQLSGGKVTLAVRGAPVINDATRFDALEAGLEEIVEIIDNGSDAPGTILSDCSAEFRRRFDKADMIIAKGQGNFETLSDVAHNIFSLHKTKCPIISAHTGFSVGSYVATNRSRHRDIAAERGFQ